MSLAGLIIALRSILIVFGLTVLGLDFFFVKMFDDHQNMGFTWRFYIQTGLVAMLTLYSIVSLVMFIIQRRRLKHGTATFESRSNIHFIKSLVQAIFTVGLSVGLLYVTIPPLIGRNRTAFLLPFDRHSPFDQSYDNDYTKYDPKNLYSCPDSGSDPLTVLCSLDRSTITGGIAIGVIAIIEALSVFVYRSSSPSESQSYLRKHEGGEPEYLQPIPLDNYSAHKSSEV
ncbi:hypothetical protein BGX26_008810 [Mortierella sp. AD094]|nr:hypothetical protein BGX26_008810 [Mortierella sp. AD094]